MKKKPHRRYDFTQWYRRVLLFLLVFGGLLGVYCLYQAKTVTPPVLEGPSYPIRTPGPAVKHRVFHVYDRLEKSDPLSGQKVSRLLPPLEVPDLADVDPPHSAVVDSLLPVGEAKKDGDSVEKLLARIQGPTKDSAKDSKKNQTKDLKDIPVKTKNGEKPSFRIQVGGLYPTLEQAYSALAGIQKKTPLPQGVTPLLQRGKKGTTMVYRLILTGFSTTQGRDLYGRRMQSHHIPWGILP